MSAVPTSKPRMSRLSSTALLVAETSVNPAGPDRLSAVRTETALGDELDALSHRFSLHGSGTPSP